MGTFLLSRRKAVLGPIASIFVFPFAARAQVPSPVADLVILTVGGAINNPNRPPFDAARDKFFNHNNLTFDRAHAFSLLHLAALRRHSVRVQEDTGDVTYTGPSLSNVLNIAGAKPEAKAVRLFAIDGYGAEIPMADVAGQKWILGMAAGDKPLAIGGFGPLRVMRDVPPEIAKREDEIQKWVYGLFYIEVAS